MKYFLTLFLVLPLSLFAHKQGRELIDSMKKELPKAIEDTNKVKLLNDLSFAYSYVSPDSGISFAQSALQLAERLAWKKGIGLSHNDIGINYEAKSDQNSALEHYNKSLVVFEEMDNKSGIASELANIGIIYSERGDYQNSISYLFKALKIYETLHLDESRARTLENIGMVYMEQRLFEPAVEYYGAALEVYQKTGNKQQQGSVLENIGTVMNNTGKYDKALEKYSEALKLFTELGNKKSVLNVLSSLGDTYNKMGDYAKALDHLQRALVLSKEVGKKSSTAIALGNIGETWFKLATDKRATPDKDGLKNSIGYLSDAVQQCRTINFIPPMIEFEEYLSRAYSLSGQYKQAYDLKDEYTRLKDSIFSVETKMQLAGMENKRELAMKDKDLLLQKNELRLKEMQLAKKHNDTLVYILSLLLMLLATAIAFSLFFKYKRSNTALQKEKEEHLKRLQLHVERIKEQSELLDEISHMQSHEVRGPVATILGLTHIFNKDDYSDPSNKMVIDGISAVAHKLDDTIQEIIKKENSLDEKGEELS